MALLKACGQGLGQHRIGLVVGDREFVGHVWLKWLRDKSLPFGMRLPKHHHLTLASGRRQAVAALGLRAGQQRHFLHCQVDGVGGQVWVKALADNKFLFLFASPGLRGLDQLYASRWTIEQCFQNLKGRGFNLEATHLRCRHKLRKLVALVSLAYALCRSVGTVAHEKIKPIPLKNHGYKATSLSRRGLNILRQLTRPHARPQALVVRKITALLDWISRQVTYYQLPKMVG